METETIAFLSISVAMHFGPQINYSLPQSDPSKLLVFFARGLNVLIN